MLVGVNIAGFDFGCAITVRRPFSPLFSALSPGRKGGGRLEADLATDNLVQGTCNLTQAVPPLSNLGGPDGYVKAFMSHQGLAEL